MTITRGFTFSFTRSLGLILLSAGILGFCGSCSTPTGAGEVTKFKSYHLTPNPGIRSLDPSIPFERKHLLYGAVTSEEKRARYGNYIDVFWRVKDRSRPATLKFEFFQTRTGSEYKTAQPITIAKPKLSNVTTYKIIGDDYEASGPVMAWKFSVLQGGVEVAKQESYLWSDTLKRRSLEDSGGRTTTIGGGSSAPSIPDSDLQKLYQKGAELLQGE